MLNGCHTPLIFSRLMSFSTMFQKENNKFQNFKILEISSAKQ